MIPHRYACSEKSCNPVGEIRHTHVKRELTISNRDSEMKEQDHIQQAWVKSY